MLVLVPLGDLVLVLVPLVEPLLVAQYFALPVPLLGHCWFRLTFPYSQKAALASDGAMAVPRQRADSLPSLSLRRGSCCVSVGRGTLLGGGIRLLSATALIPCPFPSPTLPYWPAALTLPHSHLIVGHGTSSPPLNLRWKCRAADSPYVPLGPRKAIWCAVSDRSAPISRLAMSWLL